MPEAVLAALSLPGTAWVFGVTLIAGVVYGFAGFGSALIFMPVATRVLPPEVAIGAFSLSALASLFTVVPGAWLVADRPAALRMIAAAIIATPLGVWLLRVAETDAIRLAISIVVLVTLAALIAGWRFRMRPGRMAQAGVGLASGVTGGATGLNGPVVILFNFGAGLPAAQVRANTAVFLTISSLSFLPQLWVQGMLGPATAVLGLLLLPIYGLGTWIGARAFRPGREAIYRWIAYAIIAAAGFVGLPIWE
ncbi:MAG: sulfite exporter TauE/SafE family protein [Pseudomonadota bacterium]